jgi:hypothetical protein
MFDFIMKVIYGKKLWQCEAIFENLEATWKEFDTLPTSFIDSNVNLK